MTTLLANIFNSPEEENEFLRRNILVKELVKKTFSVFNISGKNSNLGRLLKNDKDYFSLDRALKLNKRDFVAFCEFQDFILGDDFETQESSSAWRDIFNIFGIDGMRTLVAYDKNIALQLRNIFSFRYWYDTGSMEGLLWKDRIEIIETELNDAVEN